MKSFLLGLILLGTVAAHGMEVERKVTIKDRGGARTTGLRFTVLPVGDFQYERLVSENGQRLSAQGEASETAALDRFRAKPPKGQLVIQTGEHFRLSWRGSWTEIIRELLQKPEFAEAHEIRKGGQTVHFTARKKSEDFIEQLSGEATFDERGQLVHLLAHLSRPALIGSLTVEDFQIELGQSEGRPAYLKTRFRGYKKTFFLKTYFEEEQVSHYSR